MNTSSSSEVQRSEVGLRPAYPELAGKIAIVTGAAQGIGKGVAERLAAEGCRVALLDIQDEACEGVARVIALQGGVALALHCDVSLEDQVEAAVARVVQEWGGVDILVNNAAVLTLTPFEELTVEEWDHVMAVNLRGPFLLCRSAAPHMRRGGWGRVIQLASDAGEAGAMFFGTHWAVSSAGLINMTKCLALRLAPGGITVNAVAPSAIDSPQLYALGSEVLEDLPKHFPVGRIGTVAEVAAVVAFLCSDGAAFVNGATIDVNGGALMR